jgi:pilus assembly protein FimV
MGDGTDPGGSSQAGADIDLSESKDFAKTQVMSASTTGPGGESGVLESDLNLDLPPLDLPPLDDGAGALDLSVDDGGDDGGNTVDFDFDSAKIGDQSADADVPVESVAQSFDPGLEFNLDDISFGSSDEEPSSSSEPESSDPPALDLSGISLDLDETTTGETDASGKDDKWYEVQTKFDLAKAYQEMGDNDGAREILKEVISEGDSDQKAAAETVLSSLG